MNVNPQQLLGHLLGGASLDEQSATALLRLMASGELAPALAGALLVALRMKGETVDEIRGFARGMRELARRPAIAPGPYVDIVGTGGDASHSLNLSTGSALLAAACGLPVVKHGNRSVSSKSGSADVLAALGLPIPLDEASAGECLRRLGFTFLFAPHYHPAMKHIAPVRQALGVRTVFNILGPLANPVEPPFHVIGAFSDEVAELMAETLAGLPLTRAFVVHGMAGWDEATPAGPFVCYDVRPGRALRSVRDPRDAGIERCALEELRGADAATNAERLKQALGGDRASRPRPRARPSHGCGTAPAPYARRARADGRRPPAARWPRRLRQGARAVTFLERMAAASRARVRAARAAESDAALERRALATPPPPPLVLERFDVIAELKRARRRRWARSDFVPAQLVAMPGRGRRVGPHPAHWVEALAHLVDAARLLSPAHRPAMRKDFLTDPYQVLEARAAGAGGVLVIVTMLDDATVRALVDCARACGLFVLLEAFDRADLERLAPFDQPARSGPPLLAGVNCRDLRDLDVRFARFAELAPYLPRHLPTVAESGIGTVQDIRTVATAGYRLALIGSALMRAADPAAALAALIAAGRATTRQEY
jgi:anthranilate phosphoribosyltransferase